MTNDSVSRRGAGSSCARHSALGGFTLLEMVIVMFILALLVGAIFGIVRGVTQLTNDMTVEQQRDSRMHGFIELCSRTFRNLPPNAIVRLRTKQAGGRYLGELVLVGARSPVSGDAGGVTLLQTVEAPDGYLRVMMRAMTAAQVSAWEKGDEDAGLRVPLMENVATLEWKFFNVVSGEWEPVWNEKLQLDASGMASLSGAYAPRPGLVELRLAFGSEPAQRHVFWVPPSEAVGREPSPIPNGQ